LALDWHRKSAGRRRFFESVGKLPLLYQEIYRLRFVEGLALDDACTLLQGRFADVTLDKIGQVETELRESLSARQAWLLVAKRAESFALEANDGKDVICEVRDPGQSPEAMAISREERENLARALKQLAPADRLLLQLRFGHEVTLAKVARFVGLENAQAADRRIRAILKQLRKHLS
jgi:DNA-directed RNA polymerase specialized sigma24 family protein